MKLPGTCADCGCRRDDHDPVEPHRCTFGCHGYTCPCEAYVPIEACGRVFRYISGPEAVCALPKGHEPIACADEAALATRRKAVTYVDE